MRLINADALKADFEREKELNPYDALFFDKAIAIINNAPTVEPETKVVANVTFNKEQLEKIVEKAKTDILAQIERPQGEWIFNKKMSIACSLWNCSVCNRLNGNDSFNFCPHCGADMRGEK